MKDDDDEMNKLPDFTIYQISLTKTRDKTRDKKCDILYQAVCRKNTFYKSATILITGYRIGMENL